MDMKDILDFVAQQMAEGDPERQEEPMDYVLSLTGAAGGGISGSSEGGFGMRLDDNLEPPHLWAIVKRRAALSLDPYAIQIVEVDGDERPSERTTGAQVVAEHVLQPRVEAYVIEASLDGKRHHAHATISPQRYARLPLEQMANQLVLSPRSPIEREPFEAWPHGGCGLAMDLRPASRRVWAWRMPGELDGPQEVRLVLVDGDGVPDQVVVDASPVLASARIEGEAPVELVATHEGVAYRLVAAFKDSARRARALLEGNLD